MTDTMHPDVGGSASPPMDGPPVPDVPPGAPPTPGSPPTPGAQSAPPPGATGPPAAPPLGPPLPADYAQTEQRLNNMRALVGAGHQWMPPQMMFSLADSAAPTAQIVAMANGIKDGLSKVPQIWNDMTHDPTFLQRDPSVAQQLHSLITGALGPIPIEDDDITHIKGNLQKMGYGNGLQTDANWSPQWDAAYRKWAFDAGQQTVAGKHPGSTFVGTALHALTSILPPASLRAIIGLGAGLRATAADIAAGVAQAVTDAPSVVNELLRPLDPKATDPHRVQFTGPAATIGGFVEGQTPGQYVAETDKGGVGRALNDVGNVFLLRDAVKLVANIGVDAAAQFGREGVTAIGKTEAGTAAGAVVGGYSKEAALKEGGIVSGLLQKGLGADSLIGRTAMGSGIPELQHLGPLVDQLTDADGWYYRARSGLRIAYRYPAARVAAGALAQTGILGAEIRGVAALEQKVDPTSPLATGVYQTAPKLIDPIDQKIQNLTGSVTGGHIHLGLDSLAWLANPEFSVIKPSMFTAEIGRNLLGAVQEGIGHTGLDAAWERGLQMAGTLGGDNVLTRKLSDAKRFVAGDNLQPMFDKFGGEEAFRRFQLQKTYDYARNDAVEMVNQNPALLPLDSGELEKLQAFKQSPTLEGLGDLVAREKNNAERIWADRHNPDGLLQQSMTRLMHDPNGLAARIYRDVKQTSAGLDNWVEGNAAQYMKAQDVLRYQVLPHTTSLQGYGALLHDAEGRIGMARLDTETSQMALRAADGFDKRFQALGSEWQASPMRKGLEDDVNAYLNKAFRVDTDSVPAQLDDRIAQIRKMAPNLASDVFVDGVRDDGSLRQAFDQLAGHGYKPVAGRGIGFFTTDLPDMDISMEGLTRRRKLLGALGLDPTLVSNRTLGSIRSTSMLNQVEKAINDYKIPLPPGWSARTPLDILQKEGVMDWAPSPGSSNFLERVKYGATTVARRMSDFDKEVAKAYLGDKYGGNIPNELIGQQGFGSTAFDKLPKELQDRLVEQTVMERDLAVHQVRDLPRSKVLDVLSGPHPERVTAADISMALRKPNWDEVVGQQGYMSPLDADRIRTAIMKGYSHLPNSMLGISRIEDMARSGSALLGEALPGRLGYSIGNIPNNLVQLRNAMRYSLDPRFALLQRIKTQGKLMLDDVPPVMDRTLRSMYTPQEVNGLLNRSFPEIDHEAYEGMDNLLASNNILNFNNRLQMAYATDTWQKQGRSADDIRKLLVKNFGYGNLEGVAGRSAFERSVNFAFFPFSFEKTMARNVGSYLADNPAQLMLTDAALKHYDAWSTAHPTAPLSGEWVNRHAPLLKQVYDLNPYAHGLTLGRFGGLNAPVFNLLLPQTPGQNGVTKSNVAMLRDNAFPMWKEFAKLITDAHDQAQIIRAEGQNFMSNTSAPNIFFGSKWTPPENKHGQVADASQLFSDLRTYYDNEIGQNNGVDKADQLVFGYEFQDPSGKQARAKYGDWAGRPINVSNLQAIVHSVYPDYNPLKSTQQADKRKADLETYARQISGTWYGSTVEQFLRDAIADGTAINKGDYSSDDSGQLSTYYRSHSLRMARVVPGFWKVYNEQLRYFYGPLTGVS